MAAFFLVHSLISRLSPFGLFFRVLSRASSACAMNGNVSMMFFLPVEAFLVGLTPFSGCRCVGELFEELFAQCCERARRSSLSWSNKIFLLSQKLFKVCEVWRWFLSSRFHRNFLRMPQESPPTPKRAHFSKSLHTSPKHDRVCLRRRERNFSRSWNQHQTIRQGKGGIRNFSFA